MKIITTFATMFSLILLVACGGGGGGSTASIGSPAGTGGAPTGDDRVSHPPETRSLAGRTITIGGDDGVAPLSGLTSFTPTITSSTTSAFKEIAQVRISPSNGYAKKIMSGTHVELGYYERRHYSFEGWGGGCRGTGGHPTFCTLGLPGDTHSYIWSSLGDIDTSHEALVESVRHIHDLSLITNSKYFAPSSFKSRISSSATIGDVTFARGSLEATRARDNAPLEFQTFAGWLNGRIFATRRIEVGESTDKRYFFKPYYLNRPGAGMPVGTGSATWEGAAVASIKDAAAIEDGWSFIRGDSTIDIDDLENPDVDLRFDNWKTIDGREVSLPATIFNNVPFVEGRHSFDTGYFRFRYKEGSLLQVYGKFRSTGQEQAVGGIFESKTLSGAFHAVRQ